MTSAPQALSFRHALTQHPIIPDQQQRAWVRLTRTAASEGERLAARDKLILHNLRLVNYIARAHLRNVIGIDDLDDVFQNGVLGLMRAIEKYDLKEERPFASYASVWIRSMIDRARQQSGRLVYVPIGVQASWSMIRREIDRRTVGGLPLDPEVIAEHLTALRSKKQLKITSAMVTFVLAGQHREAFSLDSMMHDPTSGRVRWEPTTPLGQPGYLLEVRRELTFHVEHVQSLLGYTDSFTPTQREGFCYRYGYYHGGVIPRSSLLYKEYRVTASRKSLYWLLRRCWEKLEKSSCPSEYTEPWLTNTMNIIANLSELLGEQVDLMAET